MQIASNPLGVERWEARILGGEKALDIKVIMNSCECQNIGNLPPYQCTILQIVTYRNLSLGHYDNNKPFHFPGASSLFKVAKICPH